MGSRRHENETNGAGMSGGGGRVEVRVRDVFYQNIGSRVDRTALELNFGGQIALPSLLDNFQTYTNGFRK